MTERTYLWGEWSPHRLIVVAFGGAVAVGTGLLMLPWSSAADAPLTFVEALFTATSAVCVTGLIVVDTGSALSPLGQGVVLLLIQLGGLGIMTFSTLGLVLMGKRLRLHDRAILGTALYPEGRADLRAVVRNVVTMALAFEAVGTLLLLWRWPAETLAERFWGALFHSISAFCNAGFGLFADSLERFRGDPVVNLTVVGLFVVGGLGFPVVLELGDWLRPAGRRRRAVLSLHTKVVLMVTAALVVVPAAGIYLLEFRHLLAGLPAGEQLQASIFQALTPRTAGFNTIPVHALQAPTLFMIVVLMFIGGSPGSTAGGIKTTAVGILAAFVWSRARGDQSIDLFHRTLPEADLRRAVGLVTGAIAILVVGVFALLLLEGAVPPEALSPAHQGGAPQTSLFLELLFETTSALGTVGLSTGITSSLGTPSRLVVVLLMFIGRVGPLTVAVAISRRRGSTAPVRYPEEQVLVG